MRSRCKDGAGLIDLVRIAILVSEQGVSVLLERLALERLGERVGIVFGGRDLEDGHHLVLDELADVEVAASDVLGLTVVHRIV